MRLLKDAWRQNLGLRIAIIFHLLLLAVALVGLAVDHRVILGINAWIKPLKFDVSVLIYLLTTGALLSALGRFPRSGAAMGWGVAIAMIVEDAIISTQSFRGVRSHMNYATVGDALAFSVMGLFIALNTVLLGWLLVLYCSTRTRWPAAVAWGARLGLGVMIAGGFEGVLMVARQSHTVGEQDGGAGLTLVNWSVAHGDLRVAHFFAIHALQVMPLLGWAMTKTPLSPRLQIIGTVVLSAGYLAVIWWLFQQAMAGHPVWID